MQSQPRLALRTISRVGAAGSGPTLADRPAFCRRGNGEGVRYGIYLVIALAVASGLLAGGAHSRPAHSRAAPAVGTSSETTATPAAHVVVVRALHVRRAALKAGHEWLRARACFLDSGHVRLGRLPLRSRSEAVWLHASLRWRGQLRDYQQRTQRLLQRMRAPGGPSSGVRWLPLARLCSWPEYTLSTLAAIIQRESSGRQRALNASSGCAGLLQILPSNVTQPWRLFDPEYNLRQGLRLYRLAGWSPWAL